MKKLLSASLLFATQMMGLNGVEHPLPQMIDFGKYSVNIPHENLEPDAWFLGYGAFNYAPELASFFAYLGHKYQINTVVETGTYHGFSTACFSHLFDSVHTIEIDRGTYDHVQHKLKECPNVRCYSGSSEAVLRNILPELETQPVLFYLDAHWGAHWPLLDELEEISKTHHDNCIIVIDDFKVPERGDIGFDQYGNQDCSYEYIRDQLDKVYSSYDYHYLIPSFVGSRAKFVAIPKQWAKS